MLPGPRAQAPRALGPGTLGPWELDPRGPGSRLSAWALGPCGAWGPGPDPVSIGDPSKMKNEKWKWGYFFKIEKRKMENFQKRKNEKEIQK